MHVTVWKTDQTCRWSVRAASHRQTLQIHTSPARNCSNNHIVNKSATYTTAVDIIQHKIIKKLMSLINNMHDLQLYSCIEGVYMTANKNLLYVLCIIYYSTNIIKIYTTRGICSQQNNSSQTRHR